MLKMQDYFGLLLFEDAADDEVDDSKSKSTNYESDTGIEDSVLGFLDFGGVARGSHVLDATDNDKYNRNKATD